MKDRFGNLGKIDLGESDLDIRLEFNVMEQLNKADLITSMLRDFFNTNKTITEEAVVSIGASERGLEPLANICKVLPEPVVANIAQFEYEYEDYESYDGSYYDSILTRGRRRRNVEEMYTDQPWQVDVRSSTDEILCKGVVVGSNVVVSLATCLTTSVPTSVTAADAGRYRVS